MNAVQNLLIPFIQSADGGKKDIKTNNGITTQYKGLQTINFESYSPQKLIELMKARLPDNGLGQAGFLQELEKILHYPANTWDQGFMSKLYASTDAANVAAELILATLNTQVHTFEVSPALTIIETYTTRTVAALFGLTESHAGGISVQGGVAFNGTRTSGTGSQ